MIVAVSAVSGGVVFSLKWPVPGDLDLISLVIRYGIYFGVAFLVGYVLTAESLIRFYLSILIAAILTAIVVGLTWLVFRAFNYESSLWLQVIAAITALIGLLGGYQTMKESSWIGVPCPDCSIRGKLTEQNGDKMFTGSDIKQTSVGWRTFDNYEIEVTQTCLNCGSSRNWTKKVTEERT